LRHRLDLFKSGWNPAAFERAAAAAWKPAADLKIGCRSVNASASAKLRRCAMRERFTTEMKEAMKAGDKRKLGTVRLIQAALKDKDIEARGAGKGQASDDEILALLQKMIKQRQESIAIYEQNNRPELAQQEREEAEVIASFLPKQMDEAETKAAIEAAIAETGAASMKDMGKVVGALRAKYAGRMDFGKASGLVKEMLPKG
jgi:uncharacterized protein YqeY